MRMRYQARGHDLLASLKLCVWSGTEVVISNPVDQSELSILKIPPTDSPGVRTGRAA